MTGQVDGSGMVLLHDNNPGTKSDATFESYQLVAAVALSLLMYSR